MTSDESALKNRHAWEVAEAVVKHAYQRGITARKGIEY